MFTPRWSGPDGSRDLDDKLQIAGVFGEAYEITVIGAENASDVVNGIPSAPPELCAVLTTSPKVGVAHVGSVWVVEFLTTQNSPAHSGPMPGDH